MRLFNKKRVEPINPWAMLPIVLGESIKDDFLLKIDDPINKQTYKVTVGELRKALKQ